ncbi:hypothetical protein ACQWU4_14075 [Chryseobacterium sp. MIQD13]|uniref:hypothetical protein n=1 Tax=Chryseobacterium sp. MIQD13 TaxID=3422310 RepID=UPI003D2AFF02
MKFNLYTIQLKEKDSISDIAIDLGIDLKILIEYHNASSQPHEWIRKDLTVAPWVKELIIPDTAENLRNLKKQRESPNIVNLVHKELETRYTILQKIDMKVSGSSMIDSETEIVWEFKKSRKKDFFNGNVKQTSHKIKYIKSMYRQLTEYMQRFNKPIENLVVELTPQGSVKTISNQSEIESEWKNLRKELQSEMGDTLEEKNMLEGGDKDFSDTLPLIKNNILYNLFFNEVFQEYNNVGEFVQLGQQKYNSQIFNNEKVNITIKRKIEKEGNIAKLKFYSESQSDKNEHLRELYNTKLREFLKEDYGYLLTWSLEYHYDIEKGKMLFCHSKIKEQASNSYSHLMEHIINPT